MEYRQSALKTIRNSLRAKKMDALLITSPGNRFYLSGFRAEDMGCGESAGLLLVTRDRTLLLTDGRFREQAEKEAGEWETVIYRKGPALLLASILEAGEFKKVGYESAFMTCAMLKALEKAMPYIEFVPFGQKIEELRAIKHKEEMERIKKAVTAIEHVMRYASETEMAGIREKELAWKIMEQIYRHSDGPSFPPIIASGPNAALPHAIPGERRIQAGEPVIIDIGCVMDGYCSDMTRTFFPGGEPDTRMKEIYGIVHAAQAEAQRRLKAGMAASAADRTAREIINRAGYGDCFIHSLGHGIGIAVHEAPTLSPRNRKHLHAGMTVTIEPGIYIPGTGGVRLENMAFIKNDGAEILNSSKWYYEF